MNPNDDTPEPRTGESSRRGLLWRAGACVGLSTIGVAGTAGAADAGESSSQCSISPLGKVGDEEDSEAEPTVPADFPRISTRGHFSNDGTLVDDVSPTDYDGGGDWAAYTESHHDEVIVFVHGWDYEAGVDDLINAERCDRALEAHGHDQTTVAFSWDADRLWYPAYDIAVQNGAKLAAWIADQEDRDGDPVRLIGHSLGARIVIAALEHLHELDRPNAVESVSLLGAAVGHDIVSTDQGYGDAIEHATYSFTNFYKTNDLTLQELYPVTMFDIALGNHGLADGHEPPYNYQELDVTEVVDDHNAYYMPEGGCMAQVVEQFSD